MCKRFTKLPCLAFGLVFFWIFFFFFSNFLLEIAHYERSFVLTPLRMVYLCILLLLNSYTHTHIHRRVYATTCCSRISILLFFFFYFAYPVCATANGKKIANQPACVCFAIEILIFGIIFFKFLWKQKQQKQHKNKYS